MLCRIAIILLVLTAGCGRSWRRNPDGEYPFWISDRFNEQHHEMMVNGIQSWKSVLDGSLSFEPISDEAAYQIGFVPSTIEELKTKDGEDHQGIVSKRIAIGYCNYEGGGPQFGTRSRIQLAIDIDEGDFKWLVLHELGHALGLQHTGPNTVMCDVDSCASGEITQKDLDQFHKVWNDVR